MADRRAFRARGGKTALELANLKHRQVVSRVNFDFHLPFEAVQGLDGLDRLLAHCLGGLPADVEARHVLADCGQVPVSLAHIERYQGGGCHADVGLELLIQFDAVAPGKVGELATSVA